MVRALAFTNVRLIPDPWRHMRVEFVFGSLLAPRGFSPGTPVFTSPQKVAFSNFQFHPGIRGPQLSSVV